MKRIELLRNPTNGKIEVHTPHIENGGVCIPFGIATDTLVERKGDNLCLLTSVCVYTVHQPISESLITAFSGKVAVNGLQLSRYVYATTDRVSFIGILPYELMTRDQAWAWARYVKSYLGIR